MRVMSIQKQSFGACPEYIQVKQNRENFYELSTDKKLDVLFDVLNKTGRTITSNQEKMRNYNCSAAKIFLENTQRGQKQDNITSADRLCQINVMA